MIVDLGPETALLCGENSAYLNAHTGFYSYEWMDQTSNSDSLFAVNADGQYWVEVMSLGGCISRDSIQIQFATIPPTLSLLTTSPSCEGDTITLSATGALYPVTWQGPNAFNETGNIQTFENVTTSLNGMYTATQFNGQCESVPASVQVVVFSNPNPIILGDTILCEGDSSLLSFMNGPFDDFVWSSGETTPTISSKAGIASLSVTKNGCSNSISQTIYLAEPIANFSSIPEYFVFLGNAFQFTDSSTESEVSDNVIYDWALGDGFIDNGVEISHVYADTGLYEVSFVVINSEGCIDSLSRNVLVVKEVVIPNVFSPNGDGMNDVFEIKYLGFFETPELRIFNRWGLQIYMSDNYKSDWNGEDFPEGTYYYILDLGNEIPIYKGSILISR
jgi:gliding motility-associated-like protein